MTEPSTLAVHICELGRRMYQRGMVAANDGNLSVRLPEERFLVTPTGVSKGFMKPEQLCVVDRSNQVLSGSGRPSTEIRMHLAIYRVRPDVQAVVHAHPPYATAFAVAGRPLDSRLLAEVVVSLGSIPVAEFQLPSTDELAETVAHYTHDANAVLMSNHGAVTLGHTLKEAFFRMETLEHFARISLLSRLLGEARPLERGMVERLEAMRPMYGVSTPRSAVDPAAGPPEPGGEQEERIRALVKAALERLRPEPPKGERG